MRRKVHTIQNSEKSISRSSERRKRSHGQNGIPKLACDAQRHKPPSGASIALESGPRRQTSAIERLRANAACCYIRSDNGSSTANGNDLSNISPKPNAATTGTKLYHKQKTIGDARSRCRELNATWREHVLTYARQLFDRQTGQDRRQLKALLGLNAYSGPVRASDLSATRKFGRMCADVVHTYWLAARDLRWFHITLVANEFQVAERKPALLLKRLKGKAYKEVQDLGLNALIWIDIDPVPNYCSHGKGGTFLFHVHALCFTDRTEFDISVAREKLKKSRSWSSNLRARPTDIREITSRMGTAAWWAVYAAKPPYKAKRYIRTKSGEERLKWTAKGYRPQLAMRLIEGLAQIALFDMFVAVGEGKELRDAVRGRLMKWHRTRWPDQRSAQIENVSALFRRAWSLTRARRYFSWQIVGSTV